MGNGEDRRRVRMGDAIEIIRTCPTYGDDVLFMTWEQHLARSAEPEMEARRILTMMARLYQQGYCGSAVPPPTPVPILETSVTVRKDTGNELLNSLLEQVEPGNGADPLKQTKKKGKNKMGAS